MHPKPMSLLRTHMAVVLSRVYGLNETDSNHSDLDQSTELVVRPCNLGALGH